MKDNGGQCHSALRGVSDLGHVMFACDWPFAPEPAIMMNIAGFDALHLTTDERYSIERGNAERLFPRLAARPASPRPAGD